MKLSNVGQKQKESCCGCGNCIHSCPKGALNMQMDTEGFEYPFVNDTLCINCGKCLKSCPLESKLKCDEEKFIAAFSGRYQDPVKVKLSSSGGIADAIASSVISKGGVVYGAAFSGDYKSLLVKRIDKIENLSQIRGSKYIQSSKRDSIMQIKRDLDSGTIVLFTGLPCDVAAVNLFFKHHSLSNNLYTIELICSGNTSQQAHRQFVEKLEKDNHCNVTSFNYRYKKHGWHWPYVLVKSMNKTLYCKPWASSEMGYIFKVLKRPSCYDCKFKGKNSTADVTVGDFWGLKKTDSKYYYDGVSAIIVHSNKGLQLLNDVSGFKLERITLDEIKKGNPRLTTSAREHIARIKFSSVFSSLGLFKAYKKCRTPKDVFKMNVIKVFALFNISL